MKAHEAVARCTSSALLLVVLLASAFVGTLPRAVIAQSAGSALRPLALATGGVSVPVGSLTGWGWNGYGQIDVPAGDDFVQVAAGGGHSLAVRADGSLTGWGWNDFGQTDVPAGYNFVKVAAGGTYSLALRADGSLVGWGNTWAGQIDVPAGNDFVQVAAGAFHSLALRADGSLVGWGWNYWGQINVPTGNDYVQVSAGYGHSLALRADGSLVGWGDSDFGITNVPAGTDFFQVVAGGAHSLAIKASSPQVLLGKLIEMTITLTQQSGFANSLVSMLQAAKESLSDANGHNNAAAIHTLDAFVNAIEAQRGHMITNAQADALINMARKIINLLVR